jgi:hypothetical protein
MRLYIDGTQVAATTTTVRPFAKLDPTQKPGLGIGSLQADAICCQYFHGYIDELRLSNQALRRSQFLNAPKFVPPPDSNEMPVTLLPPVPFVVQRAPVATLYLNEMPSKTLGRCASTNSTDAVRGARGAELRDFGKLNHEAVQLDTTTDGTFTLFSWL